MTERAVHTAGPLHVEQDDKWPYRLRIVTAAGETVHSEDMICSSTHWRNLADARDLAGIYGEQRVEWRAAMDRQMADLHLRAAAPALLEALARMLNRWELYTGGLGGAGHTDDELMIAARLAIATARGEG